MSDNLRRYRAIRQALTQGYPRDAKGNLVRPLNTLAALISGMVASKSPQLPTIASKERWRGIIHRSDRCDLSLFQ